VVMRICRRGGWVRGLVLVCQCKYCQNKCKKTGHVQILRKTM